MRDYKVYLPHHREQQEPQPDVTSSLMILALTVVIIGLMTWQFMDAVVRQADIDAAVADARRKERQRIYTANQDILAGHEAYIKQMDALIDKAYRQGR